MMTTFRCSLRGSRCYGCHRTNEVSIPSMLDFGFHCSEVYVIPGRLLCNHMDSILETRPQAKISTSHMNLRSWNDDAIVICIFENTSHWPQQIKHFSQLRTLILETLSFEIYLHELWYSNDRSFSLTCQKEVVCRQSAEVRPFKPMRIEGT